MNRHKYLKCMIDAILRFPMEDDMRDFFSLFGIDEVEQADEIDIFNLYNSSGDLIATAKINYNKIVYVTILEVF